MKKREIEVTFYNVGGCPFCEQGPLLIAKCHSRDDLFVVCDECESSWAEPAEVGRPRDPSYRRVEDVIADVCGEVIADVYGQKESSLPLASATESEIEAKGWSAYVKGTTSVLIVQDDP